MRLWPARTSACTVHQDTQPCVWPCRHNPFRRFQNRREARSTRTRNPRGPLALCHCLPKSPQSTLPCSGSPLPAPGHVAIVHLNGSKPRCTVHQDTQPCRGPLALCHCLPKSPQSTLPCSGSPLPAPGHVAIVHLNGSKTAAKHGPPGHATLPWAFSAKSPQSTLPCSGSPLPPPGHVGIVHFEGFKTPAKHGPPGHETLPWAYNALPMPSQVTAKDHSSSKERLISAQVAKN